MSEEEIETIEDIFYSIFFGSDDFINIYQKIEINEMRIEYGLVYRQKYYRTKMGGYLFEHQFNEYVNKIYGEQDIENLKDISWTMLHVAVLHYNVEIIKILLNNGANFRIKDGAGKSPYDIAKIFKHDEILKLFDEIESKKS